jgi:hypothetical protein
VGYIRGQLDARKSDMVTRKRLNKSIQDPEGNTYCVDGYLESRDGDSEEWYFAVNDVRIFRFWADDCWDIVHQVVEDENEEKWWKVIAIIKFSGGRWVIDRKRLKEWGFGERAVRTARRDLRRANEKHTEKYGHPISESVFYFLRGRRVATGST